jgi:endonuclease YncB( thermonuclease family)
MKKRKEIFLLIFLIVLLIAINYSFFDKKLEQFLTEYKYVKVARVIDGDTIETDEGENIRLLGINSPEKGEKYYFEAGDFLEELILNKTVKLELFESRRYDKYKRTLAYVFLDDSNINIEIVKNGFANYYFYSGKDKYSRSLVNAWKNCINEEINLCESSKHVCAECVLISSDSKSIINNCDFDCDVSEWQIKGEGRGKFAFQEKVLKSGEKAEFKLDLTDSGGSLFLTDDGGKLVVWGNH